MDANGSPLNHQDETTCISSGSPLNHQDETTCISRTSLESPVRFNSSLSTDGCPFMSRNDSNKNIHEKARETRGRYVEYLQLDKLLDCQHMMSSSVQAIHDEHLFIVTHQAYELWFKQILFELDSIRFQFSEKAVDESKTLVIISRLSRISMILKLLVDQFHILETMTPLDFLEFRGYLEAGSGFQSLQFRLLENKLGLKDENRIEYNQQNYQQVFENNLHFDALQDSINEPSLIELVIAWLERTPGLNPEDFDFIQKYKSAVHKWLEDEYLVLAKKETNPEIQKSKLQTFYKQKAAFDEVINPDSYEASMKKGERRFSHRAFQGALMIMLYRDEPRFHQPFQILTLLMDVDSLITKWRYNHVTMVQRMIGSKIGTGGSSGYLYLRATVSDRYKVFLDLFNMATYLIPRNLIPPLNDNMRRKLSIVQDLNGLELIDPKYHI